MAQVCTGRTAKPVATTILKNYYNFMTKSHNFTVNDDIGVHDQGVCGVCMVILSSLSLHTPTMQNPSYVVVVLPHRMYDGYKPLARHLLSYLLCVISLYELR